MDFLSASEEDKERKLKNFVDSFFSFENGEYYLEEEYESIKPTLKNLIASSIRSTYGCGCSDEMCPHKSRFSPLGLLMISEKISEIKRYIIHPLITLLKSKQERAVFKSYGEALHEFAISQQPFLKIKLELNVDPRLGVTPILGIPRIHIIERIETEGKIFLNDCQVDQSFFPLISNLMPFQQVSVVLPESDPYSKVNVYGIITGREIFYDKQVFIRTCEDSGMYYLNGAAVKIPIKSLDSSFFKGNILPGKSSTSESINGDSLDIPLLGSGLGFRPGGSEMKFESDNPELDNSIRKCVDVWSSEWR